MRHHRIIYKMGRMWPWMGPHNTIYDPINQIYLYFEDDSIALKKVDDKINIFEEILDNKDNKEDNSHGDSGDEV